MAHHDIFNSQRDFGITLEDLSRSLQRGNALTKTNKRIYTERIHGMI